ncbi:MAG: hypothetical protein KA436_01620 [Oligoflexales bacterium]|nr:hypothetical protein [Oligoflexales bacterium]
MSKKMLLGWVLLLLLGSWSIVALISKEHRRHMGELAQPQVSFLSYVSRGESYAQPMLSWSRHAVPTWNNIYLSHLGSMFTSPLSFDSAYAKRLAFESRRLARYPYSQGMCMRGVRFALGRARNNDRSAFPFIARSADDFRRWVLKNPSPLCHKFKLADVTSMAKLPVQEGMIYIYGRGSCGFHKRYGHIEVFSDASSGMACSDHCRTVSVDECQPDLILAPVADCEWLGEKDLDRRFTT